MSESPPKSADHPSTRPRRINLGGLAREFGFIAWGIGIALALATGLAWVFQSFGMDQPTRHAEKVLPIAFIGAYLLLIGMPKAQLGRALALRPTKGWARDVALGFGCAASSLIALNLVLLACGAREWSITLGPVRYPFKLFLYLFNAAFLVLLEEPLYRGLVHTRLQRLGGTAVAVVLGAALFAASHFLDAVEHAKDWSGSAEATLGGLVSVFEAPRYDELFGLFLVGLVLSLARVRTGTVWLAMGLHAGWAWVRFAHRKTLSVVGEVEYEKQFWLGTARNYDGFWGWVALLSCLLVVFLLVKPRRLPEAAVGEGTR